MENILKIQIENNSIFQSYIFEGTKADVKKQYLEFSRNLLKTNKEITSQIEVISPINNNISIEEIREFKKRVFERPTEFSYKIIVIEDSHYMRNESQNAILKTLEELPEYAVVIFTTDNRYKLLKTILSRSQVVQVSIGGTKETDHEKINAIMGLLTSAKEKKYYLVNKEKEIFNVLADNKKQTFDMIVRFLTDVILYKSGVRFSARYESDLKKFYDLKKFLLEKIILEAEKMNKLLDVNINFQLSLERLLFLLMEA